MQVTKLQNLEDRWMSAKVAAEWLGISRSSFYRMVKAGKLPPPKHPLSPHMPRWQMSDLISVLDLNHEL